METPEGDRILLLDEGSGRGNKKKPLNDILPEELIEQEKQDNSESDSQSSDEGSSDSSDSDDEYVCTVCDKRFSGYLPLKQHEKGSKHKKALARKKKIKKLQNKEYDDDDDDDEIGHLVQEPFAVCDACTKKFSGPESYILHLKSKKHKHKMLETSILKQAKENGELNVDKLKDLYMQKSTLRKAPENFPLQTDDTDELDAGEYECKTCEKTFSGLVPFTQHLVSKVHAKQIEKTKLMHRVVPESKDTVPGITDVSVLGIEDDILVCKACCTSFSGPESAVLHLKSQKHKKKLEKYTRKLEKKKNKPIEMKEIKAPDSPSTSNNDVLQEELKDSSSEESDEPTSTSSKELQGAEKSTSETNLTGENTHEKIMNERHAVFKIALKSLQKLEDK